MARLPDASAQELLAAVVTAPVDERVRGRILAEARGNPPALLELPREFSTEGFAGRFRGLGRRIVAGPHRSELSAACGAAADRDQAAAAIGSGRSDRGAIIARSRAEEIGESIHHLSPAEADGLLELGAQVTFRHPLLRSAIYRAAPPDERRAAHAALAAATDPGFDPDRRAWHRAHAIAEPDEEVALELEQSAERAHGRGGLAAAAAFLERSAALTPDPSRRARRALAAATSKHLAGASQEALRLLASADAGPLDPLDRAGGNSCTVRSK